MEYIQLLLYLYFFKNYIISMFYRPDRYTPFFSPFLSSFYGFKHIQVCFYLSPFIVIVSKPKYDCVMSLCISFNFCVTLLRYVVCTVIYINRLFEGVAMTQTPTLTSKRNSRCLRIFFFFFFSF